jgi:putative hydrolase
MATPAWDGSNAALLAQDHHVHTTFSEDASSTVTENINAARARGLRTVCLADHVRQDTPWTQQFVSTVQATADSVDDIEVLVGVETMILDRYGRLDLPDDLPPVHRILIADHEFPGERGPVAPDELRRQLAYLELTEAEAVETLVEATMRAMERTPGAQLTHLFSLLPKVGITEDVVHIDQIRAMAKLARHSGSVVEANEKWGCPSRSVLKEFADAGVAVVAGTGSHHAADVGVYDRVVAMTDGIGPGSW